MNHVIDYFNIYKEDRLYIMNKLNQAFNCDIEFGKYKYTYNGKKVNQEIYYFIIKRKDYSVDDLRSINCYSYFTITDVLAIDIFDRDYVNDFTNRHNFIFKSYKDEIIKYVNAHMTFFVFAYDAKVRIFDDKLYIRIVTQSNHYVFSCKYSLYDFILLKNFINDITFRHKKGNL